MFDLLLCSFSSFAKQFGHDNWQGNGSYIHRWTRRYGIVNKAVCSTKESAPGKDQLEEWKETVLYPTLEAYTPQDIYNGDNILQVSSSQNILQGW